MLIVSLQRYVTKSLMSFSQGLTPSSRAECWGVIGLVGGSCVAFVSWRYYILSSFLKAVCVGKNQWFSETLRAHLDRKEHVREARPTGKPTTLGLFPLAADLSTGNGNGLYVNWGFFSLRSHWVRKTLQVTDGGLRAPRHNFNNNAYFRMGSVIWLRTSQTQASHPQGLLFMETVCVIVQFLLKAKDLWFSDLSSGCLEVQRGNKAKCEKSRLD